MVLSGELDLAGCRLFESRLAEAQRASEVVNLDLSRLAFMDTAGYAVLFEAARRTSEPESRLVLVGCNGQVKRLLDLVGLPEKIEFGHDPTSTIRGSDLIAEAIPSGSEAAVGV